MKHANVMQQRWDKYDWPIVLVYGIIFLLLVAACILICVCFCEKNGEAEENAAEEDEKQMLMDDM